MKYHRYTSFERGLEVLNSGYFRLSPISYFNDPFDGYGVAIGRMTDYACWHFVKRFRRELQNLFVEEFGPVKSLLDATNEEYVDIVQKTLEKPRQSYFTVEAVREWICAPRYQLMCLSSVDDYVDSNDILMWSHYADACKGIRFEIEISEADILPGFSFREMKYRDNRPELNLSKVTTWDDDDTVFKQYVNDCICTKSKVWQYEAEVRFVADMEKCESNITIRHDNQGDYDYASVVFPTNVIRKVFFGFAVNRNEVRNICGRLKQVKNLSSVEFLQMNLDLHNYGIKYDSII